MSELTMPSRARLFRERLEKSRLQERSRDGPSPTPTDEEITPHSGWTQEPNLHSLLVELPGFKEADVKLVIEKPGSIGVSGERIISAQNKRIHFKKVFNVPQDSDMESMSMKFQGEVLKVSIPRLLMKEKEQEGELERPRADELKSTDHSESVIKPGEAIVSDPKGDQKNAEADNEADDLVKKDCKELEPEMHSKDDAGLQEETIREDQTSQRSVIGNKISNNKGILLASIISFTLGFLLSKRFQPPPPK